MNIGCYICSSKCWGVDGYDGSCCSIEKRDFIIGPHSDARDFIKRLSTKLDREIKMEYAFFDYETGSKLFPDKENWQKPENYPAMRVDLNHPRRPCIFYNNTLKFCEVYDIRPKTCITYKCDYLVKSLMTK